VHVVVLDNLKEGVLTPDVYEPALNPLYRDVLAHYGAVALPCRVGAPNRKGKVESGVGHAQATPLKGQRFESPAAAQAYLDHWETRWADPRIHGTTKRQVAAMFAEEQPHLLPLPLEPFRYYQYGTRTVHLDGCVEIAGAYYAPPPGWLGRVLAVQWDEQQVRLLDPTTGTLLREHRRQPRGGRAIRPEDQPARTPPSTLILLGQAARAGAPIGALCEAIHRRDGERGVRRILGVLALVKKHGAAVVTAACTAALDLGVADYRFVRRYLERHLAPPLTLRQVDPLIRELTRKATLAEFTTVPLLIIDDLGMRKLPHTAAEDLLEIIMRRYERVSTLLTSNRPVEDWGKLLGDTAAMSALLDRLLHHAHVLTCGPRSWRTRLQSDRVAGGGS
jgi:hypothetical protein